MQAELCTKERRGREGRRERRREEEGGMEERRPRGREKGGRVIMCRGYKAVAILYTGTPKSRASVNPMQYYPHPVLLF